jgi:uncharacterized membrane protein
MESSLLYINLLIGPLMLLISVIFFYFPPKEINDLYGHRTKRSIKNKNTWNYANKKSTIMMLWVSMLTCLVQLLTIVLGYEHNHCILIATIFLCVGLITGTYIIEQDLKKKFDKEGNRR